MKPEDLEQTLKDIGTALGAVAIVIVLVTASAYSCTAEAGEAEKGLVDAMERDHWHAANECIVVFEENATREAARDYYVCMATQYLVKAEATEKRLAADEAARAQVEM